MRISDLPRRQHADVAYVRPHDLQVTRFVPGLSPVGQQLGIVAKLVRVIVVGPIARQQLLPLDAASAGSSAIIEAQMAAQQFAELALKEGETVPLTPRKACIFVA